MVSVVLVAPVVTAGGTGATAEQRLQTQDERLDNGTALTRGGGGKFVAGREDDEEMQYVGNFTIGVKNHNPGASSGFALYASGFQEDIRLHWNILYQPDFSWSSCTASNAAAYGVDRGNDNGGTQTDVSLLSAAKVLKFRSDGIYTGYYKESKLAGEPIDIGVEDQVIAGLNDCQQNPSEPGWYRAYARSNGSTAMDTQTDFAVAVMDYVYICEGCDSRQQAIEKLGPPPQTCPAAGVMPSGTTGITDKPWRCRSEDGTYYQRGEDPSSGGGGGGSTPTATPPPGGSTPTATPTPERSGQSTPTPSPASSDPATPTATPTPERSGQSTPTATPTSSPASSDPATPTATSEPQQQDQQQQRNQQQQQNQQQQRNQQQQDSGPVTPTAGSGPGFGLLAAVGGLLAVALLVIRRD